MPRGHLSDHELTDMLNTSSQLVPLEKGLLTAVAIGVVLAVTYTGIYYHEHGRLPSLYPTPLNAATFSPEQYQKQ